MEASLAFLGEAALTLGSSLDSEATLLAIGRLAVPSLADWCIVELEAQPARPRRVAVFHSEPRCADSAQELAARLTQDPSRWAGLARMRARARAELHSVVSAELLPQLASADADQRLLLRLGLGSVAIVPLRARDRLLGVLTLASAEGARPLEPQDLDAIEDFAARAATALDNASLYEASVEALRVRDGAVGALLVVARQQAAVAELGRRALSAASPVSLLAEACSLVAQALPADACGVFARAPGGEAAALVAGVGWREGSHGRSIGGAQGPLALGQPAAVPDIAADPALRDAALLHDHGLRSLVAGGISGPDGPFGGLVAFCKAPRRFEQRDVHFLQGAANVLSAAVKLEASQAELRRSEERFRALIERSSDGIALLAARGRVLYVGPSTRSVLGYSAEELVGRDCLKLVHRRDCPAVRSALRDLAGKPRASVRLEHRIRHRDGSWRWVETVLTNLLDEPSVAAVVANYRDIGDRKRAEEQIRYSAQHDALTDLPNRLLFGDRLALALAHAHRTGSGFAVLSIDLDHLKQVNDALGHAMGDRLLRAVADRLKAAVRETDSVARVGGDEFMVVLQDVTRGEDAERTAHKILAAVARPFELDGRPLQLTASIGIAVHPQDGLEPDALLRNADQALYRAKASGRNGCRLCTPELGRRARA